MKDGTKPRLLEGDLQAAKVAADLRKMNDKGSVALFITDICFHDVTQVT